MTLKPLQNYHIPFTGLKTGKHQFDYQVEKSFFDEFEHSLVKDGSINVSIELDKQETFLILQFHISGSIQIPCDVCLADYPFDVVIKERLIAKFSENEDWTNDTEEVLILNKNDNEIDVSLPIYEYINLAVPYIGRHRDESLCDQDMIAKLKQLSGEPKEQPKEQKQDMDPRWDALKNINTNKN